MQLFVVVGGDATLPLGWLERWVLETIVVAVGFSVEVYDASLFHPRQATKLPPPSEASPRFCYNFNLGGTVNVRLAWCFMPAFSPTISQT